MELATKNDFEDLKQELKEELRQIREIITGTLSQEWVNAEEACTLAGISKPTLRKWAEEGRVTTKAKSSLPNAQHAYSKIDCMRNSKLMNIKSMTL